MTWVKICGMTNLGDAQVAVDAGADAVGFVFYEKSPRNVSVETARDIIRALPQAVEKVGVFVNRAEGFIESVIEATGITAVQMHGDDEDPRVADLIVEKHHEVKVLRAISMKRSNPEGSVRMWHPKSVHAFVLDSGSNGKHGGTGETFDWTSTRSVDAIRNLGRVVAAGGLNPANVREAIIALKPWGVDVVSGVEASPGKKDPEKVRAFVQAVREIDKKVG
jgi:phosphoribosylanthranilate isomerase